MTDKTEAATVSETSPEQDLVDRLLAACNGHPHAKIPWPHRLLHEAVDAIKEMRSEIADYQELFEAHKEVLAKEREIAAEMERLHTELASERLARMAAERAIKSLSEQLEDTRQEAIAERSWHHHHRRRAELFEQDLADALSDDSTRRQRAAQAYSDVLDARAKALTTPGSHNGD